MAVNLIAVLNENCCNWIRISMKSVPSGSVNNMPKLIQIIAWRYKGRQQANIWTNDGPGY